LDFSFEVKNLGPAIADQTDAGVFLSLDSILDEEDEFIIEFFTNSLAKDVTQAFTGTLNIDQSDLEAGEYFLLLVADYEEIEFENDEDNNLSSVKLDIGPQEPSDLLFESNVSVTPLSVSKGFNFRAIYNIRNLAFGKADESVIKYYLSTDSVLTETDILISELEIVSLNRGEMLEIDDILTIPDNS